MIWKVLGSLLLLKYGITLSQFLWTMIKLYFLPRFGMKKNLKKYGSWAVITGATDGIGKAIAKQLAKRGLNLVLISRSEDKLKDVAEEFGSLGVEVKTITYDFNNVDGYEVIENALHDLDIGILVNNVGVGYDHPEYFLELTNEFADRTVNVNVTSIHKMTKIVIGGMIERKRGLVVYTSSGSSLYPIPLLTLYSASKVFVNYFANALGVECANSGLDHQVLTPYFVATNMSQMRARGISVPSADRYAESAVDAFGLSRQMCGWWAHEIQAFLSTVYPRWYLNSVIMKMMIGGRKKWLRKQEEKTD